MLEATLGYLLGLLSSWWTVQSEQVSQEPESLERIWKKESLGELSLGVGELAQWVSHCS